MNLSILTKNNGRINNNSQLSLHSSTHQSVNILNKEEKGQRPVKYSSRRNKKYEYETKLRF